MRRPARPRPPVRPDDGALYAQAIRGARAMRSAAVQWADGGLGADATERALGVPEGWATR